MTNHNMKNNIDNKIISENIKSQIYVSALAGRPLLNFLENHGFEINMIGSQYVKVPVCEQEPTSSSKKQTQFTELSGSGSYSNRYSNQLPIKPPVYNEIATHADIYMCQLGLWENARIFPGNIKKLQKHYPGNIIYNAVCTGKYFIHNLKYTSPQLLAAAGIAPHNHNTDTVPAVAGLNPDAGTDSTNPIPSCSCLSMTGHQTNEYPIPINVPQGYTRCTCLPVDDRSFITSDMGIAKVMSRYDTDVLLIEPGHVKLPGFKFGFIGGCAGNVTINGQRTIIFNGNISAHPDYKKIADFIEARDISIVYFDSYQLEDIGSILTGCPR